jgi:ABC-2 type transport system permease protein
MLAQRRHQRPGAQLWDLLLIQLSNWRWSWPQLVLTGMLAPLASTLALGAFARQSSSSSSAEYVLVGSVVLGLLFQQQNLVASNFAFMKQNRMLGFFATLPLRRSMLIVATVAAFFLLSLPALAVIIVVGSQVLDVSLSPSPLLVLALPLAALPMAATGALIGSSARTFEESSSLVLALTVVMAGAGPVVIPPTYLPDLVVSIGWLNPAAYAASALRQALIGPVEPRLAIDLAVLGVFAGLVLWFADRRMPWRNR